MQYNYIGFTSLKFTAYPVSNLCDGMLSTQCINITPQRLYDYSFSLKVLIYLLCGEVYLY